ncbi:MAG: carbonic anhydrase, partial [Actinomycetota bacterium]|nr:carbonic anhydrase [Actinomycetota bacterium]
MDVIDELIANNRDIAASLPTGHLDVRPSRRLAIVTCMDSRLNVFAALGLRDGEAHVLRNAG